MWLKTENFSNACGTATLKSLPSRSFFTPHVHPRPRKRLARCTLDCGFKTPESPALRGFEAERCPITGTSLYLVLKSNGLHCPKIRLKKFGFSPIDTPANIAKKLPPQRCFKPLLIALFNFSHKRLTFALTPESGYTHSAFGEKSHTTAYTPKQGPSFPRPQRGFALPVKSILFRHAFIYIHFPVLCGPPSATAPSQTIFHPDFQLLAQMAHVRFHRRKWVHPALLKGSHTRAYTPNHGYFRWGWYHYPRTVPHVSETLRGQGVERQTLPFLGLGRGHSRRTQRAFGTAMRLYASLFRGVAAPLGCVILLFVC